MAQKFYIYGKHAVREALAHAPQVVRKLYFAPQMDDKTLRNLARDRKVATEKLDPKRVTSMVEGKAPHQGAVALISLGELLVSAEHFLDVFKPAPDSVLVLLSGVQDPHNTGAIIRSAAAFGASAVLIPVHGQSPVTPAVIKASAGMAFQVPLIAVENMQQTIARLKKLGVRTVGFAAEGSAPLQQEAFDGPTLMIFGNEAEGVAPAARALCDAMLSIPIAEQAESLNVAAAAAVALYAWRAKR